jgi:flagellar biosynthesis protein FlhF
MKQAKKVGIINTDSYRIGAQEQLTKYADLLECPLQLVYRADELQNALEDMADRELIFVDTAGKKPGDIEHREYVLDLVRILKPEEILLCLSATTGFAATKEIIDTYGFVEDYKLLVTKLDETRFRGPLLNMCWYTEKPLSYVTTGQNVPDDFDVVDVELIAKEITAGSIPKAEK